MKKRYIILIAIIASFLLILTLWFIASLLSVFGEDLSPRILTLTGSDGSIEVAADPRVSLNGEGTAVLYTSDNLELEITVADSEDAEDGNAGVRGTTKDGLAFTANDNAVYIKVGGSTVKAKVVGNNTAKDAGKIAGVVSALTRKQTGYKKGVDDYNHNYSFYYIEPAQCLLYYPSQLTVMDVLEDNSVIFKDTRSEASLRVTLESNPYLSMDELEGFIKKSKYNLVLAMGSDWYTAEKSGKGKKTYTYVGLGEYYMVNAELNYADSDSFVFEELRKLIKCRFIDDGIWISEALAPGYKSEVLKDKYKIIERSRFAMTSYYSPADSCRLVYPDVFTVVTSGTNDGTWFADPATGAYINLYTYYDEDEISLRELIADSPYEKADIDGAYSVRFSDKTYYGYENFERVIAYRDGMRYYADFYYPREYEKIYSPMEGLISIILPGGDVGDTGSNTEMQTIYYPAYRCAVTIPAQFYEREFLGEQIVFEDEMTGLAMTLTFSELADKSESDNLFGYFDCKAPDENIVLGEDWLKWHDKDGLRIGAAGERYGALLLLPYPNAYKAYEDSFDRFEIRFLGGETLRSEADEIREYAENPQEVGRGDVMDDEEYETAAPDTISDTTTVKTSPAKPEPTKPESKAYSYENIPIDEIWELGEPSSEILRISGDINVITFDHLTDEIIAALEHLLNTLIELDFSITDAYENDEYNIYRYDIEGYLPETGEFVYMTFDVGENGAEDWRVVLTYVFKRPVGEVKNGGLLWDEDDRADGESRMFAATPVVQGGMELLRNHLENSGKDPDDYIYMFGSMQVRAGEISGDYDDDYDVTLPLFSYGSYDKTGAYVPAQSFVYEVVSGFLYRVDNGGSLIMLDY